MRSRGTNYSSLEDCALATAWLKASEDPILGSEQTSLMFFTKIFELYGQLKPPTAEERTIESLKSRCKLINKESVKFTGCVQKIRRSKPTGVNDEDIYRTATALYNGVNINSAADNCGKPFKFFAAWKLLRNHQKFMGGYSNDTPKSSMDDHTPDEDDAAVVISDEGERLAKTSEKRSDGRPKGRRKAKEALARADSAVKKLKLAQVAVDLQKERNEALDRHNEILLFSNAPAECDTAETVEFFNLLRAEALRKARTRASSSFIPLNPSDSSSPDAPL